MTELQPGQTVPFVPEGSPTTLTVDVRWDPSGTGLDASALLLTGNDKVRSDADFVFFNQPRSPEGTVQHSSVGPGHDRLTLELGRLGAGVERVLLAASVDAAAVNATFAQVRGLSVTVSAPGASGPLTFAVPKLTNETALRLAEVYPRSGQWRVRAVAQGYASGLAGLATEVGISVEEPAPVPAPSSTSAPSYPPPAGPPANLPPPRTSPSSGSPIRMMKGEEKLPVDMRKRLDLRKKALSVSLVKHGLTQTVARVALVVDASGSMAALYQRGEVAQLVERVMTVAAQFDDDGSLDAWVFASKFVQPPALTLGEMAAWIPLYIQQQKGFRTTRGKHLIGPNNVDYGQLGHGNDEPLVMNDVIEHFTRRDPSPLPTFIVFVSDGGIYKNKEITKLVMDSASLPIFWQFAGIGRANFGILEKLDEMPGRVVDNAGFFSVDNLERVSDEQLYDMLLSEFPMWLSAAKAAGILRSG